MGFWELVHTAHIMSLASRINKGEGNEWGLSVVALSFIPFFFFHSFIISNSSTGEGRKNMRRILLDYLGSRRVRDQENAARIKEKGGGN